jgi:phosphoglycerate dehydrogenase-like enzyme
MAEQTLLVLGNPIARHVALLDRLPDTTRVLAGETEEALIAGAADAQAVLMSWNSRDLMQQIWPKLRRLEWVHVLSAGLEGILFPELVASPVPLTNSRGVFARSLGEFAIAGMLHFAKNITRLKSQQAARQWIPFDIEELHGRVLGIVGYGAIGRAAAERAKAFGMQVHVLRRFEKKSEGDPLVDRVHTRDHLLELMAASDYVLVSAPLTAETRALIGAREFAAMKPSAVLVNVGRGPVVVESELIKALSEGRIRGAVLDVFDTEPLPEAHPFWGMENVLLSPHTADHTSTWLEEAMEFFIDNYKRFAAGEPLLNVTDKQLGY